MNKRASMSPAIQNAQMEQQGGAQQSINKEDIFNQLFADQAYKSFTSKFPYMIEFIKNFSD